jgi:acetyltransferase EpsM
MILIGASGHAKVIVNILTLNGIEIDYFIDANQQLNEFLGRKVLAENDFHFENQKAIISIGANHIRKRISLQKLSFISAIHPRAIIDNSVTIGEGTVVMASAVLNANAQVGTHCIINTSCSIDHDCMIDDFVHISPGAILCGGVHVGEGSHVGAGAIVIPNIKIGKWVTIGAGSVIINDLPDLAVVVGNPSRIIKYNNE